MKRETKFYDGWWWIGDGEIKIRLDDCEELNNIDLPVGFIDLDNETRKHICKLIFEDYKCGEICDAYIPQDDIIYGWEEC